MDIEPTHKDLLSKKFLADKLDKLADRVIKRGIVVVEKNSNDYYNLIDYFTKEILLEDIPYMGMASTIANYFNTLKNINKKKTYIDVQHHIDQYHKYNNDCLFYRRTIKQSSDSVKVAVALTRLDVTLVKLKSIQNHIQAYSR